MERKLDILLVEDDADACKEMSLAIDDFFDDFNLVSITNSASTAIKDVVEKQPDILILDLELTLGQGTGIEVLEGIKKARLTYPPYIVITTNNISNITHSIARENGGDFIFTKNQQGYSAALVINFLKSAKQAILNRRPSNYGENLALTSPSHQQHLYKIISNYLLEIGVSPKNIGFKYLENAIYLVANNYDKPFLQELAMEYKKTPASIERAMQNAINRTWATENVEDLLNKYKAKISSSRGVPTINEFVHYYSHLISVNK